MDDKKDLIPAREFARRIGVSLTAVQKAVREGRITAERDEKGHISGIDWATQESAWFDNSQAGKRRKELSRDAGASETAPSASSTGRHGGRPRKDATSAPDAGPPPAAGGMKLSEIQRAQALVKLQREKLKLEEEQKALARVVDVRRDGAALASTVMGGLYSIPDRCANELAGMTDPAKIHQRLVAEIDQAVEQIRKQYGR